MQNQTFVVFTGPASNRLGKAVLRADLKALAERRGYVLQSLPNEKTALLVASRTDTVKARAAFLRGIKVLSYPDFIDSLGGEVPTTGAAPNKYTDGKPDAPPVTGELTPDQAAAYVAQFKVSA